MKIQCPECGKTLYTNPFWTNRQLDCPYCGSSLMRNPESSRHLIRYFFGEGIVVLFLFVFLRYSAHFNTLAWMIVFYFIGDIIFEIPQRYMYYAGQLIYQKREKLPSEEKES